MTEEEWLAATDPVPMLAFRRDLASNRKMRLLAVGCCWRLRQVKFEPTIRDALAAAELYADGWEKRAVMVAAGQAVARPVAPWVDNYPSSYADSAVRAACQPGIDLDVYSVIEWVLGAFGQNTAERLVEQALQAALLRDIFGNPFRPVALSPSWLTSTVLSLAEGIYADRAFDRLPILADALQDAGCDNADVLSHCRFDGPHVRGCWVVDQVLGKNQSN